MSAFLEALLENDAKTVRNFLEAEPGLSKTLLDQKPPLSWACGACNAEAVEILLEFDADPNQRSSSGEAALHVAAFEGCIECIMLLISGKADVNALDADGKTPLMNAAQVGDKSAVKALIAGGAGLQNTDRESRSALHWAVIGAHDDPEIVRMLTMPGSMLQETRDGLTALEYSQQLHRDRIYRELVLLY